MSALGPGNLDCRFIPLFSSTAPEPVRVCAVVQKSAGRDSQLILLSSTWLGRACLGALVDAGNRVHDWLELWVQTTGDASLLTDAEPATNTEMDLRWARWVRSAVNDREAVITGFETRGAPAIWFESSSGSAILPREAGSGEAYSLCRDDARLLAAQLPTFSGSRRRFLEVKDRPDAGFISVSGDALSGAGSLSSVLPAGDLVPFNPGGGSLFVRHFAPLEWEQHRKLLSGGTFSGLTAGNPPINLGGPYEQLQDWNALQQSGAYLFSTTRGRAGRFHETFHLKLLVWLSALRAVRERVRSTQLPQLHLTPAAFRVDLSPHPGALPVLWTARAVLVEPPSSIELPTPGDLRYFKQMGVSGPSIFLPSEASRQVRGRGEVRIRRVTSSPEGLKIEATLVASELARGSPRDLVWVKLPMADGGVFDLVGKLDAAEGLASGEALFRTTTLPSSAAGQAALQKMEGGLFPSTSFSTIPLLSSPVDLYSLGVLGIQLLLGGADKPLAESLDEILSLARTVTGMATDSASVRAAIANDKRWLSSIGPQHHGHGLASADDAAELFPQELWWDALSLLGRFFPAASANAYCRDLGDAPPLRLEAVFDNPVNDVEALVLRSQSLLLCDWPSNREIAHVIQKSR